MDRFWKSFKHKSSGQNLEKNQSKPDLGEGFVFSFGSGRARAEILTPISGRPEIFIFTSGVSRKIRPVQTSILHLFF